MKRNRRTGESPLSGAVLIPALGAVLIQEAVTGLSHTLSFSTGHAANACPPSPDTTKRTGPSSDTPSRKRQFVPTGREGEGEIECLRGYAGVRGAQSRFPRRQLAATHVAACLQNGNQDDEENTMSLPRSDYDPRRVCLNPFPFLSNINIGKHRRAFGVYLAGGLVSPRSPCPLRPTDPSIPSSPSESGHSLMPPFSPRMRTHHTTNRITRCPCTSPSQIGSPGCARSSASSS
jgi:hypothetical protein